MKRVVGYMLDGTKREVTVHAEQDGTWTMTINGGSDEDDTVERGFPSWDEAIRFVESEVNCSLIVDASI